MPVCWSDAESHSDNLLPLYNTCIITRARNEAPAIYMTLAYFIHPSTSHRYKRPSCIGDGVTYGLG